MIKTLVIFFKEFLKKFIYINNIFLTDELKYRIRDVKPNQNDKRNFLDIIDIYYEFPSVKKMIKSNMNISLAELNSYNHITYLRLL